MDDKELHSLLFSAIHHDNDSLLEDLLEGDNVKNFIDLPGSDGNTLLHVAVLGNKVKFVEYLLNRGANPNVFDTNKARTPLHLAIELDHVDIVRTFLELEHINLSLLDDRNLSCHEIAQLCDNLILANLIERRHEEIKQLNEDFYTVMNQACSSDDPDLVLELIKSQETKIIGRLRKTSSLQKRDEASYARMRIKELINWSSSSWNDVTLLFKSASKGLTKVCKVLIEFGSTAKCNQNTNYSPLYVAAYGGHTQTAKLLLDNFPSLICEITIEKWTVLHACCLQGHSETAKLILRYPYPEELKKPFYNRSGSYVYHFPFDLNAQDAAGQTVIYLSVSANDESLLDTLLHFNIDAKIVDRDLSEEGCKDSSEKRHSNSNQAHMVPDKPKVLKSSQKRQNQNQVDKIIKKLNKLNSSRNYHNDLSHIDQDIDVNQAKYLVCPFDLDIYCDYNSKTALHLAVCRQYHKIVTALLVNGADPNLPLLSRNTSTDEPSSLGSDDEKGVEAINALSWLASSRSTCLKEACLSKDNLMCEILIRYGAKDKENLALEIAATTKNTELLSKLLALNSHVDPEYKINKKCNVEFAARYKQAQRVNDKVAHGDVTTFSSMFPSSPVIIDWQNLRCIKQVDPRWLIEASLSHNKRLKHPITSLMAITRLDLSSNNLKTIHNVIFRLPSLRELNLSRNRIESLTSCTNKKYSDHATQVPTMKLIESHKIAMKRSKSANISAINLETSNIIDLDEPQQWDMPHLEILDLHDNLLISVPDCLFELPKLRELDVSSNQIRQLPSSMWTSPSLRELIASGNLLDDLPRILLTKENRDSETSPTQEGSSPVVAKIEPGSELSSCVDGSDISSRRMSIANSDFTKSFILDLDDYTEHQFSISDFEMKHTSLWRKYIDIVSNISQEMDDNMSSNLDPRVRGVSKLSSLNLSHNSFTTLPPVLSCVATELTRLNLSFNRLTSMGCIAQYPAKIKTLDLSHNQIDTWFRLIDLEDKICSAPEDRRQSPLLLCQNDDRTCCHKSHRRLDNLRSLSLCHNNLTDIQLSIYPTLSSSKQPTKGSEILELQFSKKENLTFPVITAIDLSFNRLRSVTPNINSLKDLSVLNLSNNSQITTLPPQLGLSSKLWNLGINGCNLNEPLKSIAESKTYKTMDIIGYLRSILEESKPYARMKLMLVGLQGIGKTSLLEQMRQEGSSGLKRRLPEHWTKRMGHATRNNLKNQKGVTLSTVGVDIHDWIYCKRIGRNLSNLGPVTFSTWDFGGQEEFYATHRYFLSKRSIYIVVWRLTDGIAGINSIQQWLVNIQSRASGSPVIIVGTHEDMIDGGESGEIVQSLQEEVHKRFIDLSDHNKCGLPRVMESLVVSTKTKLNIKLLCDKIYDIVFSIRSPGSSERLLEQKIPATYLYLEEIVTSIVHERHQAKKAPVLTYFEYRRLTSDQMLKRYNKLFRDLEPSNSREINYNSELQQATRFLHENGVLLHYEDANLRDLYFLDPQWLCDILSHVVTIREINPHVKNGLMKIDDLNFLFRSIEIDLSGGIQSYVINLLNKFEVALTWNSQYLLIPSLLPSDAALGDQQDYKVRVAPRARGRSAVRRYEPNRNNKRSISIEPQGKMIADSPKDHRLTVGFKQHMVIRRMILLRYLPAGFLARLQSGMLSEIGFEDICADIHSSFVQRSSNDYNIGNLIGGYTGWTCWKNGIHLSLQQEPTINSPSKPEECVIPLITIEELINNSQESALNSRKFMVESLKSSPNQSNVEMLTSHWCNLDVDQYSNVILVSVPVWSLKIIEADKVLETIEPDHQSAAQLLATAVEHIDNLLEDWYPSLGTRFAHTLGGSFLVTRIVPCPNCFNISTGLFNHANDSSINQRQSRSSRNVSRRFNSTMQTRRDIERARGMLNSEDDNRTIFAYYVENCILEAYNIHKSDDTDMRIYPITGSKNRISRPMSSLCLRCPEHGIVKLSSIAPDILFEDLNREYRIESEDIERCKLIGRGTFGFVFKGSLKTPRLFDATLPTIPNREVALKLLQPNDPGPDADQNDLMAFRLIRSNWEREPFEYVCKSYCTARHEVNILQSIRHPNIVLFMGICLKPLALILELAPMGSLSDVFKNYRKSGTRIDQYSVQRTILQVAKALEFVHQQRIIYRDLKAENILVWSFPSPFATRPQSSLVEVKLADYGISRQANSTGIWKGFAGTMSFLAPEILRHNGDEEYTDKVDCFSFGVFLYELLTLRQMYKQNETIRSHLTESIRPTLALRDLIYPDYMLDLMSICWSQEPHLRPSSSQIVSIASAPEFMQLYDVNTLDSTSKVTSALAIQYSTPIGQTIDLWMARQSLKTEVITSDCNRWRAYQQIVNLDTDNVNISAMSVVDDRIWICDTNMLVHMVPLGSRLWLGNHQNQSDSVSQFSENLDMNRMQTFSLNLSQVQWDEKSIIVQMVEVKEFRCLLIRLDSGVIWIMNLDTMVIKILVDDLIVSCMDVLEEIDDRSEMNTNEFLIFCGHSSGISWINVHGDSVSRQVILPFSHQQFDSSGEKILESSQSTLVTSIIASRFGQIWTSAGCTVHLWNMRSKSISRKLDCWKLVPCSESLESINIEKYYQQARSSTISSMVYLNNLIFLGTSHGCFMVVEASSLKPMIVFRPYESAVTIFAPLLGRNTLEPIDTQPDSSYLVTIGSGYRNLMRRYVSSMDDIDVSDIKDQVSILWSASYHDL